MYKLGKHVSHEFKLDITSESVLKYGPQISNLAIATNSISGSYLDYDLKTCYSNQIVRLPSSIQAKFGRESDSVPYKLTNKELGYFTSRDGSLEPGCRASKLSYGGSPITKAPELKSEATTCVAIQTKSSMIPGNQELAHQPGSIMSTLVPARVEFLSAGKHGQEQVNTSNLVLRSTKCNIKPWVLCMIDESGYGPVVVSPFQEIMESYPISVTDIAPGCFSKMPLMMLLLRFFDDSLPPTTFVLHMKPD
ncbi:hypothetical protein VNO77_02792 [Canavalia gladiata]|uniref:Uncharacterized protein n=1 Tax=Canavalia gladiata TaxID=3824 RepID=A0AAN9MTS3_CANGL